MNYLLGKLFFQNRISVDNRFFEEDREKNIFEESLYVLRFAIGHNSEFH